MDNAQHRSLDNNGSTLIEEGTPTAEDETTLVTFASSGRELTITCPPSASIDTLKVMIADHLGISLSQVSLLVGCDALDAGRVADAGAISCVLKPLVAKVVFDLLKTSSGANALPSSILDLGIFRGRREIPQGCVFLGHDKLAIPVSPQGRVCIFDVFSRSVVDEFGHKVIMIRPKAICYCASTKTILVAGRAFDLVAGRERGRIHSFSSTTYAHIDSCWLLPGLQSPLGVAVTVDGRLLAVIDEDTNYCHVVRVQGSPGTPRHCDSVSRLSSKGDSVRLPFSFDGPSGVAFACNDAQIIVADARNQHIVMFDVDTLEVLWFRPSPQELEPVSVLLVGDKIMVLMRKRLENCTKLAIYAHPVYHDEASIDEWCLLSSYVDPERGIDRATERYGLALWAGSVLAVMRAGSFGRANFPERPCEVLVFK